jgi:hypothetical protein
MNAKTTILLTLLAFLSPAATVLAQCDLWVPGPLGDDLGPNGTDGAVYASTTCTIQTGVGEHV